VSQIRLYIDEDSMDQAFLQALRARGVAIRTAYEEGMVGRSDIDQLRWAATQGRVLYSFNVGDFYHLHTTFLGQQEDHAGIILVQRAHSTSAFPPRGPSRWPEPHPVAS
jgi:hypothetical protein